MQPKIRDLHEFVLTKLEGESIATRCRVMRPLAMIIGDEAAAKQLNALADELEQIEAKHRQLVLDFKRRST